MAILNATDLVLKVHTTDGSEEIIAHATNCSLEVSMDERDITTKGSGGWKEIGGGLRSWSVSTDALYSATSESGADFSTLFGYLDNRSKVYIEFTLQSTASGDNYYEGQGYITSLNVSGGVEETATYSINIAGSRGLTEVTVV